jgi:Xaa-Pro aminopeptidase
LIRPFTEPKCLHPPIGAWDAELWSGFDRFAEPRGLAELLGIPSEFKGLNLAVYRGTFAVAAPAHEVVVLRQSLPNQVDILPFGQKTLFQWLTERLVPGDRLWIDHTCIPARQARHVSDRFTADDITCSGPEDCLVQQGKAGGFSLLSAASVKALLTATRERMLARNLSSFFFSRGVVASWMLGLRPTGAQQSRVTPAWLALAAEGEGMLFTDAVPDRYAHALLADLQIGLKPLDQAVSHIQNQPRQIYADLDVLPSAIAAGGNPLHASDPSLEFLPVATTADLREMRRVQFATGCAFVETIAEVEAAALLGALTESALAIALETRLRAIPGFVALAFPTIVAAGQRSASPHPDPGVTARRIKPNDPVLIDIGIHTARATTDMTRTIVFGKPDHKLRVVYTTVVRALAALSSTSTKSGPTWAAEAEEAIAQAGYRLTHGLGHAVVPGLHVHAPMPVFLRDQLLPSTLAAVEPGIYLPGEFGVRLENMVRLRGAGTPPDTLTCVPFSTRLLLQEMMSASDLAWVTAINAAVKERLRPALSRNASNWVDLT